MPKRKWTVEFEVDDTWISDGFEITDDVAEAMLSNRLGFANPGELDARVISSPDPALIRSLQGYDSALKILERNDGKAETD